MLPSSHAIVFVIRHAGHRDCRKSFIVSGGVRQRTAAALGHKHVIRALRIPRGTGLRVALLRHSSLQWVGPAVDGVPLGKIVEPAMLGRFVYAHAPWQPDYGGHPPHRGAIYPGSTLLPPYLCHQQH